MATYVLNSTTKTIKANLVAAATTVNPDFTVAYADTDASTFTEDSNDGTLSGTTDVTLVAAPAAGYKRVIKEINIYNRDTAAVTLTVKYDNNGTQRHIARATLASGDRWTADGVYDSSGNLKNTAASNAPIISNITGFLVAGAAGSVLSIVGSGFGTGACTIRFSYTSNPVVDVSATPTTNFQVNVTVPAAIYNLTAGTNGSITVFNSLGQQSNSYVLAVGSTSGIPTGGTISVIGNYRVHIFTSSGNFVVGASYVPANIDYLVVGGGGGGGNDIGGGGGAGGYLAASNQAIVSGTYTVTVGGGGAAAVTGSNSFFYNNTAFGGGAGGSRTQAGAAGGSGGGGATGGAGGAGTVGPPRQGYNGGGSPNGSYYSGGGGGSAAVGVTGDGSRPDGGAGTLNTILGQNYYWAAGGGGSGYSTLAGNGGIGGGGGGGGSGSQNGTNNNYYAGTGGLNAYNPGSAGGGNNTGGPAGANTGSGGGGGGYPNTAAGTGGSGIVIIRYLYP